MTERVEKKREKTQPIYTFDRLYKQNEILTTATNETEKKKQTTVCYAVCIQYPWHIHSSTRVYNSLFNEIQERKKNYKV